jgi:nucleoside-diphosphate-sugar epimerase
MRVVVVGASGNVGTSVLAALAREPAVDSVLGIARRVPEDVSFEKTDWAEADVVTDDLVPLFRGADAVVHLAWLIQPSRDRETTRRVNVDGSAAVFRAAAEAGVGTLVYASSVGAYSPGPKDRTVDESWQTDGISSSYYSRQKAEVERLLDRFEQEQPQVRSVRLRPALIFKRESAGEQRRLFVGPFFPRLLARRIPLVPNIPRLRFQAVHSYDVGEAYRLAVRSDVRGAFNVAADPILDPDELRRILRAPKLPMPVGLARGAAQVTFKLHLQTAEVGWVDMALQTPLLDWTRAREELRWRPVRSAEDAIRDLLAGLREDAGLKTPPLERRSRAKELAGGVGEREGE